jgi:hypothetical protein
LIGAVKNAKNNDEIVVMASGSPYNFASEDKDIVAHLYARVKIILRGETGNPADVVLVGNENRILYLTYNDNSIRDLTFENGDCTGYPKRGAAEGEPYDQLRGGAICLKSDNDSTTIISNCVFKSCKAKQGGGACGTYSANNTGGKYIDCLFDGNAVSGGGGGALYGAKSIAGCKFENNSCQGGNGGALYNAGLVESSTVVSNAAYQTGSAGGFGGGVCRGTLTGCLVASNYAYRCGAAADSSFFSCTNRANSAGDYSEFGATSDRIGCFAEKCTFADVGMSGKKTFGASAFNRCRFDGGSFVSGSYVFAQAVSMTNCLLSGASGIRLFEGLTGASTMANCTIASNSYTMVVGSSQVMTIKNCFFCGNKIGNAAVDINENAKTFISSFRNCIISAASDDHVLGRDNFNYYSVRDVFKPGFAGAEKNPENPFAITRKSPAFRMAGIVEDWMLSATDIRGEGFSRVRDGKVDIGCYQCWDVQPGLGIIFR